MQTFFTSLARVAQSKVFYVLAFCVLSFYVGTTADRYFGYSNKKEKVTFPVLSDGAGYYAYAPQWFIYGPGNFSFVEKIQKKYPKARFTDNIAVDPSLGKLSNKYYAGTSLMLSPFFAIAHVIALNSEFDADGFSYIYMLLASIAALFYFLAGLLGISYLLKLYEISRFNRLLVVVAVGLGTNLMYYTVYFPTYSHVFSFASIAWFLVVAKRWFLSRKAIHVFVLFFLLGLIFIIRPTNIVIVSLLPFLHTSVKGSLSSFWQFFKEKKSRIPLVLILFLLPIAFQFWNVYVLTGRIGVNTYSGEGFDNWNKPEVMNVLFSMGKGLFVFAPILLLPFLGLFTMWSRSKTYILGFVLFFVGFTYVTSAWWCWWYGGGLGMRPYIDILAVFAIPLAFLFEVKVKALKVPILLLAAFFVVTYQTFDYQMSRNILHYHLMSYAQMKEVFYEKDKRFEWYLHLPYDTIPSKHQPFDKATFLKASGESKASIGVKTLSNASDDDNLKATIFPLENGHQQIAGKFSGYFKIVSGETNPLLKIHYFLKGKEARIDERFLGPKIKKVNEFYPIEIDVFPKLKNLEIDSIGLELFEGNHTLYVKELHYQPVRLK